MVHVRDDWEWYGYDVNRPAAITASILFGFGFLLLAFKVIKTQSYYVSLLLSSSERLS